LLFWLGSIEFETPRGRFLLTGTSDVHGSRRRTATDEEVAQVWTFVKVQLLTATYDELFPLYELYQELTSDPFNGRSGEPHLTEVLSAIGFGLRTKQLHLQFEPPFDPLPELEWEPASA
jgi:hypothetical protein